MTFRIIAPSAAALLIALGASAQAAPTASSSVFATGGPVGGTQPDSVTIGDGSVWVEYGNSVDFTGAGGTARSSNTAPAAQFNITTRSPAWSTG